MKGMSDHGIQEYGQGADICRSASRLYRGISAPILMEAPKRATKFAANDEWGKVYRNLFGVSKMNQSLSILTGASAGATEAFVVVPFELVKIRLQGKHCESNCRTTILV